MTIADSRVVAWRWKFFEGDDWHASPRQPVGDDNDPLVPLSLLAEAESRIVALQSRLDAVVGLAEESLDLLEYATFHDGRYDQMEKVDWQKRAQKLLKPLRSAALWGESPGNDEVV